MDRSGNGERDASCQLRGGARPHAIGMSAHPDARIDRRGTAMIKIGIVGGTGYTGVELLRLLAQHPRGGRARDHLAQGCGNEGRRHVREPAPPLRPRVHRPGANGPQGVRRRVLRNAARRRDGAGARTGRRRRRRSSTLPPISASRTRRSSSAGTRCRMRARTSSPRRSTAFPEINREAIRKARIVGNPGCYPTAVQLGFLPLVEGGLVDTDHLIADAKSGVSGAGRKAELNLIFPEAGGQLRRVRRQGPSAPAGNRPGAEPREQETGEARVHAAPRADDPRHPRHALRAAEAHRRRPAGAVREALRRRAVHRRDAGRVAARHAQRPRVEHAAHRRPSSARAPTSPW